MSTELDSAGITSLLRELSDELERRGAQAQIDADGPECDMGRWHRVGQRIV